MGKLFDYNNKIMQFFGMLADLMVISILWLLLSLTVVGFGPACTAAYYATAKSIRHSRGGILQEFWFALKSNFCRSMFMGLLTVLFAISLFLFDFADIANFLLYGQVINIWALVFCLLKATLLFTLALYLFPLQSRFQIKFVQTFITATAVGLRYFGHTLLMLTLLILAVAVIVAFPYLIVLIPGLFFYGITFPMECVLLRLIPDEDKVTDAQKDQWYLEQ